MPKVDEPLDLDAFSSLDSGVFISTVAASAGRDPIAAVGPGPRGAGSMSPGTLSQLAAGFGTAS